MRGLYFYGCWGGSQTRPNRFRQHALDAARGASEIFLSRRLDKRRSNGAVMKAEFVNWGGTSARRMNPWVTADALSVLVAAGRWKPQG
jgi:hypothetical protein